MIPASAIARLATLGLSPEQASAVADMLTEVERATEAKAGEAVEARRKSDRERQARHRDNVKSRDITGQNVTERDTETAKESLPHTPSKKTTSSLRSDVSFRREAFIDQVWKIIPKRRGDAPKPFRKALGRALDAGADPVRITGGLETYIAAEKGADPQYRKGAAVWVNSHGWEADYSAPARAGPACRQSELTGFHAVNEMLRNGNSSHEIDPFSPELRTADAGVRPDAYGPVEQDGIASGGPVLDLRPERADPR